MSPLPLVSAIVLNYNNKSLTEECLESLLQSDYPNFEILLIDNNSTDDSRDYLQAKYKNNNKIQIIRNKTNGYVAGGFHYGSQFAKGEKIIFLNNDIVMEPSWITELVKVSLQHPTYIIQPKIRSYWNKETIDSAGGYYNWFGFGFAIGYTEKDNGQYDKNKFLDYAQATICLIDRNFYIEIGGFDPWFKTHYEDVDLCLRAVTYEGRAYYCGSSVVYHRGGETYKHQTASEVLIYHVRKNRLRTIVKNTSGLTKYLKIICLLGIYCGFVALDCLQLKFSYAQATIRSVLANLHIEENDTN